MREHRQSFWLKVAIGALYVNVVATVVVLQTYDFGRVPPLSGIQIWFELLWWAALIVATVCVIVALRKRQSAVSGR